MGDRVKAWEAKAETHLDLSLPLIVRLDGCSFHTYTRGFRKPCDPLIYEPMIQTTRDLVEKFNARLGYTESDEITLVFMPPKPDKMGNLQGLYSYRLQKICSITASYASVRFNHHSSLAADSDEAKKAVASSQLKPLILDRMRAGQAVFDSRVFNAPSLEGAMESVYWRHHYDCHRNSVSGLGQVHFSHKQLHGMGTGAILNALKALHVSYNDLPAHFRFGSFIKRRVTFHTLTDEEAAKQASRKSKSKTAKSEISKGYYRTEVHSWAEYWDGNLRLLTDKYLNQDEFEAWQRKQGQSSSSMPVAQTEVSSN